MPSTFRIPKADLTGLHGGEVVMELTRMIAPENGLQSQGYADVCEIPLAPASVGSDA